MSEGAATTHELRKRGTSAQKLGTIHRWSGALLARQSFWEPLGAAIERGMNMLELPDRDRALREDVRLVGRVLGNTIRQQEGEAVFATVERIRQISIAFRREGDAGARRELEAMLDSLSHDRTIEVVRAFSYFSHLANIAEDQHQIRCMRALPNDGKPTSRGTIQNTLALLKTAKIPRAILQALFDTILVSPVLTAHPTEVRRKSVLDREMEVAQLLAGRDRMALTPTEVAAADDALSRAILILWQTSLLRRGRPTVVDEVANGLSYYDHTFFRELPRLYADLEDGLAAVDPAWRNTELPSFIRMGSWIGGDRDGNPFVNADVLCQAVDMQSKRVLDFYLDRDQALAASGLGQPHVAPVCTWPERGPPPVGRPPWRAQSAAASQRQPPCCASHRSRSSTRSSRRACSVAAAQASPPA